MKLHISANENDTPPDKEDRRVALQLELPFITEEGLVLVDRRAKKAGQSTSQQKATNDCADIPMFDTHFDIDKI